MVKNIRKRILIADDSATFGNEIQKVMQNDYIEVTSILSKEKALESFLGNEYCLVIIFLQPSTGRDMEILRMMREIKSIPIMVLTPKLSLPEKITLYHAGANVCLEKPVNLELCIAQANSLIHLYLDTKVTDQNVYPLIFGTELIINPIYRQVIIDGNQLVLTRKEFDLLLCLARHPGQIWSRTQLYSQVWSDDLGISGENTVRAHIGNLKKKLANLGKNYIQTSWGVGYKFVPPVAK